MAGTAGLAVSVVERRPAYYEIGMGVGSRERLRVLGAWGHNNLWGSGQRLQLRSRVYLNYDLIQPTTRDRATPQVNYRFDVLHTHPHFLRERLRLDSNVYLEKETRGESGLNLGTRGFSLGTQFPGRRGTLNLVSLQVESAKPTLHPDASDSLIAVFDSEGIQESQTHSVNHGLYLEGRDNIFHPTRGTTANVQTEIAGGFLGGDNSFAKVGASWHVYVKTPIGGVVAFRTSVGAVRAFGDSRTRGADGVPYQERFFAGGVSSVRGYLEGSLGPQLPSSQRDSLQLTSPDVPLSDRPARGGNYLLLTNVEWRFPLPLLSRWKLSGVLFADGGNVWERMDDIRLRSFRWRSAPRAPDDVRATKLWDYRYSVGTGLRLDTPFGPFRLDVGFPLKRARLSETASEDKVLFHFSLGYPF
jgi:outer membrane protein assembly factor BamA